jgi:hypothetical protein
MPGSWYIQAMPFVSVTRLHIRSLRFVPAFLIYTFRSTRQVRGAGGYRTGWLGREGVFGFWTATVWRSQEAMQAYRNSPPHLAAMGKLLDWCDEASFANWEQAGDDAPDAVTAYGHLRDEGRTSKVRHPSPQHRQRQTVGRALPKPSPPLRPTSAAA